MIMTLETSATQYRGVQPGFKPTMRSGFKEGGQTYNPPWDNAECKLD